FPELDTIPGRFARVREACQEIGRDPDELVYSLALVTCVGADEAEFARRAAAIGREPEELRRNGVAGTVAEAVARTGAGRAMGVQRLYLQVLDLQDLDHLELLARAVVPRLT